MNKDTQTMMLVPQGSIEAYIRAANEYPMLTAEEEKELAERLYYQEDLEAAKKLILFSSSLCYSCRTWLFRLWSSASRFDPRR